MRSLREPLISSGAPLVGRHREDDRLDAVELASSTFIFES